MNCHALSTAKRTYATITIFACTTAQVVISEMIVRVADVLESSNFRRDFLKVGVCSALISMAPGAARLSHASRATSIVSTSFCASDSERQPPEHWHTHSTRMRKDIKLMLLLPSISARSLIGRVLEGKQASCSSRTRRCSWLITPSRSCSALTPHSSISRKIPARHHQCLCNFEAMHLVCRGRRLNNPLCSILP